MGGWSSQNEKDHFGRWSSPQLAPQEAERGMPAAQQGSLAGHLHSLVWGPAGGAKGFSANLRGVGWGYSC